ncbi:MAG: hypothetical protein ACM31C_08155 [Acidobacteriota bacterium]
MTTRALATRRAGTLQRPAHALLRPTLTTVLAAASALALASTLVFLCAVAIVVAHWLLAVPAVRARRAQRKGLKRRYERRHLREHTLELADVSTSTLCELTELAEGLDPEAADPLDLEPLLDRYVELALARQRCWNTLRYAGVAGLQERLDTARMFHPVTAEVLERRVAYARKLDERGRSLEDSLAEVADLIRCYAERASLPADATAGELDPLANVLVQIDAADAVG